MCAVNTTDTGLEFLMGGEIDPSERPALADNLVDRTIARMRNGEFIDDYVDLQTRAESVVFSEYNNSLGVVANQAARQRIQIGALSLLLYVHIPVTNDTDEPTEAMFTFYDWNKIIQTLGDSQLNGSRYKDALLKKYESKIKDDGAIQTYRKRLENTLLAIRASERAKIQGVLEEITLRKDEPAFQAAAGAWANSWDSRNDVAEDGRGYNAGLIHFFEYRSNKKKNGRFAYIDYPMTVDGFIAFTTDLQYELQNIGQIPNRKAALIEDADGKQRAYILIKDGSAKDGGLIVAFKSLTDESLKITSYFAKVEEAFFDQIANDSVSGKDRGSRNVLTRGQPAKRLI